MSGTPTPLSLNEICFYFTRAAVGAGAPFGIGEDFAEAAKHLAYLGVDPARAAVPALRGLDCGRSGTLLSLRSDGAASRVGSPGAQVLSALYAGPAIADRLSIEAACGTERRLRLDETDQPLLIVGAVVAAGIDAARIAVSWPLRSGRRVAVEANDGTATVAGAHPGDAALLAPARVDILLNGRPLDTAPARTTTTSLADGRSRALRHGVAVDEAARSAVLAFFERCLVPTTARSRDAGAGAGLTDND